MNRMLQRLLLVQKCEIKTKLSKAEVLRRLSSLTDLKYTDYYGKITEDRFFIAEKSTKHYTGGHSKNSFAPVAVGGVGEGDEITTVSVVIRMNLIVLILFAPLYLVSLITVILFPFMHLLLHFAFFRPALRLKEAIEDLIV